MVILYGGKIRGEGTCEELLSSKERTSIETDELDDATIAEIDEVIRRRSAGGKSILSVSSPRQKLEELFLGIVEKAQAERTTTSGVTQGGETPSFLRSAADPIAGDELIDSLLRPGSDEESELSGTETEQVSGTTESESGNAPEPTAPDDDGVISALMNDSDAHETIEQADLSEQSKHSNDQSNETEQDEVDSGIIDSLLDSDNGNDNGNGTKRGNDL